MGVETRSLQRKGRWAMGELAKLKELYGTRSEASIARALGRSVDSIQRMVREIFPPRRKTGPWTAKDVTTLKQCLGVTSREMIARKLGRSVNDVQGKIAALKRTQFSGPWNPNEIQHLKQIYGNRSDEDLQTILGRSIGSIQRQAQLLRLSKDKGFLYRTRQTSSVMRRWSREQIQLLKDLYPNRPNLEIAKALGKSVKSVVSKAHDLELKKEVKRLREMGRENVALRRDRTS